MNEAEAFKTTPLSRLRRGAFLGQTGRRHGFQLLFLLFAVI
jgi:hypothetical protein